MAAPTDIPEWASDPGAAIIEPTAGKQGLGWLPTELPPAEWFNWWMNLVYLWIVHVRYWGTEHQDSDGQHSNVNADSVTIRSGGTTLGYSDGYPLTVPLGPIGVGQTPSGVAWALQSTGPADSLSPGSTASTTLLIGIPLAATGDRYRFSALNYLYSRQSADSLTISVIRRLRGSPWTAQVVATTGALADTSGTLTAGQLTGALAGHQFDDTYEYFVQLVADADSAGTDIRVASLTLDVLSKIAA